MLRQSSLCVSVHSHRCIAVPAIPRVNVKARAYSWRAPRGQRTARLPRERFRLLSPWETAPCFARAVFALAFTRIVTLPCLPNHAFLGARAVGSTRPVWGRTERLESKPQTDAAKGCSGYYSHQNRSLSNPEQKNNTAHKGSGNPCLLCSALLIGLMPVARTTGPDTATCAKRIFSPWNRRTIN